MISLFKVRDKVSFLSILSILLLLGCSEESSFEVRAVNISVDKTSALASTDSIIMTAEVLDELFARIEGLMVDFYVDNTLLPSNIFYPSESGTFDVRAQYQDISSDEVRITVIDFDRSIDKIELLYTGTRYLTNTPWSASSRFSHRVTSGNTTIEVENEGIPVFMNGVLISERTGLTFDQPGVYTFHTELGDLRSNDVKIHVRNEVPLEIKELPFIIHTYGVNPEPEALERMINLLDEGFLMENFDLDEVRDSRINPNAVNTYIRLVPAGTTPDGLPLGKPGLNVVEPVDDELPLLNARIFDQLREKYNWNPDRYINIWLAQDHDFYEVVPRGMIDAARGLYTPPILLNEQLPGLATTTIDTIENLDCIYVNGISVLNSHPDFLRAMVGHFLGLFKTFEMGCLREGDYCGDTPTVDLDMETGPNGEFKSCEGYFYLTTNYMSLNSQKSEFTYDQRHRMRFVLDHGINRPD